MTMETRAPVVECADRAAARARQAATTPEICIAFPTVIERRPKILRLEDKSDPFMLRSTAGAAIIESQPVFHNLPLLLARLGVVPSRKIRKSSMWRPEFCR